MKKPVKILLIIIAAVILIAVLAIGAVMIFNPSLVRSVYYGLTLDSDEIEEKKKENNKQQVEAVTNLGLNMTEEDKSKFESGEMTEEEIKNILLGVNKEELQEKVPESDDPDGAATGTVEPGVTQEPKPPKQENVPEAKPNVTDKPEQKPSGEKKPAKPDSSTSNQQADEYQERIAELVAKMYALKSQYTSQINGIVALMKADYAALPKEQQNMSSKTNIANGYLGQVSALEAQCDAQVDMVVTELRDILIKSGQDTSLADAVLAAYVNEKEITKAAYINKYSD